jgi:DNA modification methylase
MGIAAIEFSGRRCAQTVLERLKQRAEESWNALQEIRAPSRHILSDRATYIHSSAFEWLAQAPPCSIHAVVTDPPYSVIEYDDTNHKKLRAGRGGVWRIPPSFDGAKRQPVPRFTVLTQAELTKLHAFFLNTARQLLRVLVPGGHVFIASNPLLSTITFHAFMHVGFEKRGEIIRLVQTLRGGDRPKGFETEYAGVSVMPRSSWEPWGLFRKPVEGTVADNLAMWGTGGLRRVSGDKPFKDVIYCPPTRPAEKKLAPHPSLKPQSLMRKLVHAALPLGVGIVYDPFAGSGSTLAAAEAVGYMSIGTDSDSEYFRMAATSFPRLVLLPSQTH